MKTEYAYIVMCLKKSHPLAFGGQEIDLELNWADGMCGAMPIFKNRKSAEKYAENKYEIVKVKIYNLEEEKETRR
jgi:hypothetical protein